MINPNDGTAYGLARAVVRPSSIECEIKRGGLGVEYGRFGVLLAGRDVRSCPRSLLRHRVDFVACTPQ